MLTKLDVTNTKVILRKFRKYFIEVAFEVKSHQEIQKLLTAPCNQFGQEVLLPYTWI